MKTSIYILAFAALFFTACNDGNNQATSNSGAMKEMNHKDDGHSDHNHSGHDHSGHDHGTKVSDRNITSSNTKNKATNAMIDGYIAIKNGLVEDDKSAAAKGGQTLLSAMSSFDMSSVGADVHKEFMEIFNDAKEQVEHIVKSPIDHQREHFEVLSVDINDMIDLVGTDKKLYQDFCPMANDGKGAIWISEIENIRNPFFGSKMMKCGKIQKEFN